ncbi:MAG TPA: FecR family protein [Steroidobacteraceae bacterium]|nr:FecR family protein [Steroidobacteraceae bacterium]
MTETTGRDDAAARSDPLAEIVRAGGRRPTPPPDDYDQVLAAATASWQKAVSARRRRQWIGALAASAVLCAVGLAVFHFRPIAMETARTAATTLVRGQLAVQAPGTFDWHPLQAGAAIDNGARLRANGPGGASLSLGAGGLLRLRESTEVAVSAGAHLQLFDGSAYVDSGSRPPGQPIVVETGLGTVRDIGTVFEVRASAGALRVRVREGQVVVDAPGRDESFESQAGQELQIGSDGTTRRSDIATAGPEWAWAEALADAPVVDGKSLLGFLEWVSHESGRALEFQYAGDRQQAAAVRLHGSVPNLRPLDALDLMLAATDFDYTLSDAGAIVIRRRGQ